MINDISTNKGERLTFLQLFNDKKWKIEIPIIQRDYAQGRQSTKEIRDTFLNTLQEHLKSGKNIDLDFVYGSLSESDASLFIPLDGQQRLTTLFLLHWYLANVENKKAEFDASLVETKDLKSIKKSKFTYETRTSSREFCDALVCYSFNINDLLPNDDKKLNSFSKTIRDNEWFFNSWEYDPTIQSMLTMLDAIHEKFMKSNGYFDKLLDTNNPVITFQFLNLKEFKLTDDLYIKMNARGKQLTPFENFKAKFEQHITDLRIINQPNHKLFESKENVSVEKYFSHKIDTDWADLFWNYRDEKTNIFDTQLMNFIRIFITNHYALKEKEDNDDNLKLLIGKEDSNRKDVEARPISFFQYKAIDCLDEKLVLDLIAIFDLIGNDDKVKKHLIGYIYFDEEGIFNDVIKNSLNYTERLRFYAFYHYLITNNSNIGLEDWIRVVYNLTENTVYNNLSVYTRSLKSLQDLLPNSSNILEFLSYDNNKISGFFELQITEERIKAILLQKSDKWKNAIFDIERHGYFNGQIGFLLNFAEIEGYYSKNKNCNWSDAEDTLFYDAFANYTKKAIAIFDSKGLRKFSDFIWERALLSKGIYLLYEKSNLSFLIDNDRDISWKRLLRDENSGKREFVKNVFDDDDFDNNQVEKSLQRIIAKSLAKDWRRHFIALKDTIGYLGFKKYIRWRDNGNTIYLLEKERMSASHVEYYSYSFYLENLINKAFPPFPQLTYYSESGDEDSPFICFEGWKYLNNKFDMYVFAGSDSSNLGLYIIAENPDDIPHNIRDILVRNGLKVNEDEYFIEIDREKCLQKIKLLCKEFLKLS